MFCNGHDRSILRDWLWLFVTRQIKCMAILAFLLLFRQFVLKKTLCSRNVYFTIWNICINLLITSVRSLVGPIFAILFFSLLILCNLYHQSLSLFLIPLLAPNYPSLPFLEPSSQSRCYFPIFYLQKKIVAAENREKNDTLPHT